MTEPAPCAEPEARDETPSNGPANEPTEPAMATPSATPPAIPPVHFDPSAHARAWAHSYLAASDLQVAVACFREALSQSSSLDEEQRHAIVAQFAQELAELYVWHRRAEEAAS